MKSLATDFRHALRIFRGPRSVWLTAVVTIALGVGANSAVFSLVDGMLFRPLPYAEPERLFMLTTVHRQTGQRYGSVAAARLEAVRTGHRGLAGVVAYGSAPSVTLLEGDPPERLTRVEVSPDFFSLLGVRAAVGRTFRPGEDTRQLLVLSDRYWKSRFGGDPRVVGRWLRTEEEGSLEVIGVLPADFFYPDIESPLVPDAFTAQLGSGSAVRPIARLAHSMSVEQANAVFDSLVRGADETDPARADATTLRLIPLQSALFGPWHGRHRVLLAASAFVLLIACANLATLLLARGLTRSRELAARAALGASRARLVRLVLGEAVAVAGAGGLLAALLGPLLFSLAAAQLPPREFRLVATAFDVRVLAFAAAATLVAALLGGLPATLRHTRPDVMEAMRKRPALTGRAAPWLGRGLVSVEVALGVVLLAGASLMVKSFVRLDTVDLGFAPDRVLTVDLQTPSTRYPFGPARALLHQSVLDRLEPLPGVTAVAGTTGLPMLGEAPWTRLQMAGHPDPATIIGVRHVTDGYFDTLGLRLAAGRPFTRREAASDAPVAIVNEHAARRLWGDGNALGKLIRSEDDVSREIVGVVANARRSRLKPVDASVYIPFPTDMDARSRSRMDILVRASGDPRGVAAAVRETLRQIDPAMPVRVALLDDQMDAHELQSPRFLTGAISLSALLALAIAAVGIFGVVGHTAARRIQEIGIRMALGASEHQVRRLLVAQASGPIAIGLAAGIAIAAASTRVLKTLLFEVAPTDPPSLTAAVVLFAAVAMGASYLPARRASRLDPSVMLRDQ